MKAKKGNKRDQQLKMKDQMEDSIPHSKKRNVKVKYNHKSHWLQQDENYELTIYKDEEE